MWLILLILAINIAAYTIMDRLAKKEGLSRQKRKKKAASHREND